MRIQGQGSSHFPWTWEITKGQKNAHKFTAQETALNLTLTWWWVWVITSHAFCQEFKWLNNFHSLLRKLTRWKWGSYCTEIISTLLTTDLFCLEGSWFWGNLKRCLCPVFLVSRWIFAQNRNLESFTFDQRKTFSSSDVKYFILLNTVPVSHAHQSRSGTCQEMEWCIKNRPDPSLSSGSGQYQLYQTLNHCMLFLSGLIVKESKLSILTIWKLKFLSWLVIRYL